MGGPRYLDGSVPDSQPLNASPSSSSRSKLRRFLNKCLCVVGIFGATMGVPSFKARGDELKESGSTVLDPVAMQELRTRFTPLVEAVGAVLAQQRSAGDELGLSLSHPQLTYSHHATIALLQALADDSDRIYQLCGLRVAGATPQDQLQALNRWLNSPWQHGGVSTPGLSGRTDSSPIDQAAFDELDARMNLALAEPSARAATEAVLRAAGSGSDGQAQAARDSDERGESSRPNPTPPPPSPYETTLAGPTGHPPPVIPAPVAAAPAEYAPTVSPDVRYSRELLDLEFISVFGRTAGASGYGIRRGNAHDRAGELFRSLNGLVSAPSPNQGAIDRILETARPFIAQELQYAQQRAAQESASSLDTGSGSVRSPLPDEEEALRRVRDHHQGSGQVDQQFTRLLDSLPRLDDSSAQDVFSILQRADSASSPDETLGLLSEATTLFRQRIQFYSSLLTEYVIPMAEASASEVSSSSLPTDTELQALEVSDGVRAGTYYNVRALGAGGVLIGLTPTGRGDIVAALEQRAVAAESLVPQPGTTEGDAVFSTTISYRLVSDLLEPTRLDARAVHQLVGMWEYVLRRASQTDLPQDLLLSARAAYAQYASILVNPRQDPFGSYTEEERAALERALQGSTRPAPSGSVSSGTSGAYRYNIQLNYDVVMFGLYRFVSRMEAVPATPEVRQPMQQLAQVRALRTIGEYEHQLESDSGASARDTFDTARQFLQDAVATYGGSVPSEDQVMISAARAWLARADRLAAQQPQPAPGEFTETSAILYVLARTVLSIREAEIWLASPGLHSSSLSDSTISAARDRLTLARRVFGWNFSGEIPPTYHPNLSLRLATEAAFILMPHPLSDQVEASAAYFTHTAFDNPEFLLSDISDPPMREDRMRAAAAAELSTLSFLYSLRDYSGRLSAPSPADATLSALSRPFRSVSLAVGRNPPASSVYDFPEYTHLLSRERPSMSPVDEHVVRYYSELPSTVSASAHEPLTFYPYGQLYVEVHRLTILNSDPDASALLRGLDVAPDSVEDPALRARLQAVARSYNLPADRPLLQSLQDRLLSISESYSDAIRPSGSSGAEAPGVAAQVTPTQIQERINQLYLAILAIRIAQLQSRLESQISLPDGRSVPVSDLAQSSSPNAYYVRRAQEALDQAISLRLRFTAPASRSADLFVGGPADPREITAMVEMSLDSLDDSHLSTISAPPLVRYSFDFDNPESSVRLTRGGASSSDRIRAVVVSTVMVRGSDGTTIPLEQYEHDHHQQQRVSYSFFVYQDTGVQDANGDNIYLLLDPTQLLSPESRPIGMVMRDVLLPDGSTGDAVVRVRPVSGARAGRVPWEADTDDASHPRVLYPLRSGTLTPVVGSDALNSVLPQVSAFGDSRRQYIEIARRSGYTVLAVPTGTPIEAPQTTPAAVPVSRQTTQAVASVLECQQSLEILRIGNPGGSAASPARRRYDELVRQYGGTEAAAIQTLTTLQLTLINQMSPLFLLPSGETREQDRSELLSLPPETRASLLAMLREIDQHLYDSGHEQYARYVNPIVVLINLLESVPTGATEGR